MRKEYPTYSRHNGYVLIILYLLSTYSGQTRIPSATPALLTACRIVTKAEVEQAIGRVLSEGSEEIEGRASTCDYNTKLGLVSITLQRLSFQPNLPRQIAALKQEIPEGVVRDAPGFSGAFYFDLPGAGTQLHIINTADGSSAHLMISILGFGDASQVSGAAAQIARKALSRM